MAARLTAGFSSSVKGAVSFFGEQKGRHQPLELEITARAAGHVVDIAGGIMVRHNLCQRLGLKQNVVTVGRRDGEADDEILATGAGGRPR